MKHAHVHILIIDDEKDLSCMLANFFTDYAKLTCVPCFNGELGMSLALEFKPDLILLDLIMPDVHGDEVLRRLKPLLPETKFIITTGWPDKYVKENLMNEMEVSGYFEKPVGLEELSSRVFELLNVDIKRPEN